MGVITITIARSRPGARRTSDKGPDLTALYLDLYERLQKALEEAASVTHDDYDPDAHPHAPAGQSNGGQFVSKGGGGGSQSLERRLVASWASSSGDHNALSCALQQAAQDSFSLPEKAITKQQLGSIADYGESQLMKTAAGVLGVTIKTDAEVTGFRQALQEFTHAQYDHTQDFFKSLGKDHVFVARGMKMNPGASHMTDKPANVKLQPASSFSADYATASMFAGSSGTVFLCKIPVSQVLGTYLTGFGCTSEHEVVVLGHDTIKSYPVKKKENMSLAAANESVKQRIADGPKKKVTTS